MCRIGDTGRLGQFAWNFEFLKNISIFLFFVSIFHNRKTKLKQNGYMKQHCWRETTLKSWVITKSDFYEFLSVCIELIAFYPINIAKTNVNAFVIIYTTCWNLVTSLRLRSFKVAFFCWKGNFLLCLKQGILKLIRIFLINCLLFVKGNIAYTGSMFVASFESVWKCTRITIEVHYW